MPVPSLSGIKSYWDRFLDYFRNLKFDGQVISRNKLPTMGEPGTYSKTTGGHVIVFDPDGRRMANISKERIKKYLMK